MKADDHPTASNRRRGVFDSSTVETRDKEQVIQRLLEIQRVLIKELEEAQAGTAEGSLQGFARGMAAVVTNAWKAKAKIWDGHTGEPREDMRRVYRHLEAMFDAFQEMGLRVKDHTGDTFDYGLPLTVIATEPTAGIAQERVIETIKPTIYWNETIIQTGEVVIATPQ